jgi:hypothetical protein
VEYPIEGNGFSDMILMMDGKYLISAHHEGILSVYDADECTVEVFEDIFGYVDTIWSLEPVGMIDNEGKAEYFVAATTNGMYVCAIYDNGKIIYTQRFYYEGCNVTNVEQLDGLTVFITLIDPEGNDRLVTLDVVSE